MCCARASCHPAASTSPRGASSSTQSQADPRLLGVIPPDALTHFCVVTNYSNFNATLALCASAGVRRRRLGGCVRDLYSGEEASAIRRTASDCAPPICGNVRTCQWRASATGRSPDVPPRAHFSRARRRADGTFLGVTPPVPGVAGGTDSNGSYAGEHLIGSTLIAFLSLNNKTQVRHTCAPRGHTCPCSLARPRTPMHHACHCAWSRACARAQWLALAPPAP